MSNIHKQIFNTKMKYLVESKTDYILQNEKAVKSIAHRYLQDINLSIEKMTEDQIRQAAEYVLKKCEELPYTNKYMIWLMKQYIQGKFIIPEDLSKLNLELERFSKISHKLEKKDINNYSWEEFLDIIPKLDNIHTSNEEERIAKSGAVKVFEDDYWYIINPKTQEAACYYGKGTRWCTASTESENYFDYYNDDGNIYIIINKQNPKIKYQFHVESKSFMNANDLPLIDDDIELLSDDEKLLKKLDEIIENGMNSYVISDGYYVGKSVKANIEDLRYIFASDHDYDNFVDPLKGEISIDYFDFDISKDDYEVLVSVLKKYLFEKGINIGWFYHGESRTLNDILETACELTKANEVYYDNIIEETNKNAKTEVIDALEEQIGTDFTISQTSENISISKILTESDVYILRTYSIFGNQRVEDLLSKISQNRYAFSSLEVLIACRLSYNNIDEWIMMPEEFNLEFDSRKWQHFVETKIKPELDRLLTPEKIKKIINEL